MSRTPARITQADVARAIRAARQTGAETAPICIRLSPQSTVPAVADDEPLPHEVWVRL
ncbi:hypothetical protein [Nitrobacter sp. JJSN]|uniref:hypothetical protein n=1 Tax=Nitrobacter sp. JJSN TaxID=3453033 RepID=UPI003F77430C